MNNKNEELSLLTRLDRTGALSVQPLQAGQESEVLTFLRKRSIHGVFLASLILDNGLDSPFNRGRFYCCRNVAGQLEGVGLLGFAILLEVRCESALLALAELAKQQSTPHVLLGEHQKIARFWQAYAVPGQQPRLARHEILMAHSWPAPVPAPVFDKAGDLRPAQLEDLPQVMGALVAQALVENGDNPYEMDPIGFPQRCRRRIEQSRVWVLCRDHRLIFKAEVVSRSEDAVYLEGVYVHPNERRKGIGRSCLTQLTSILLQETKTVCLLADAANEGAQRFYRRVGYTPRAYYDTIFL